MPALVASLVIAVFTFAGTLLCIIPGLVVAAMYKFTYLFIVDKRMDFWPAMQASHAIVKQDYFGFTMFLLALARHQYSRSDLLHRRSLRLDPGDVRGHYVRIQGDRRLRAADHRRAVRPARITAAMVLFTALWYFTVPAEPRYRLCGFHWLTGRECPLCGLTRAMLRWRKDTWWRRSVSTHSARGVRDAVQPVLAVPGEGAAVDLGDHGVRGLWGLAGSHVT